MEYTLIQNADIGLVYYGVYNTNAELIDSSDMLCKVRRNYFESGRRQKNRYNDSSYGQSVKCSFSIEAGKPLKWKKMTGNIQTERAIITDKGYYVESLDLDKKPYKKAYFDNEHNWTMTEYYSSFDKRTPYLTLTPSSDGNKPVIVKKTSKGEIEILYPFECALDKAMTEKLNIIAGEPEIFCRTGSGNFYFCGYSESVERKETMNKLIERESADYIPLPEDSNIVPAFEVNTDALSEADIPEKDHSENAETQSLITAENTAISDVNSAEDESVEHEAEKKPVIVPGETADNENMPDLSAENFSEETPDYNPDRSMCSFFKDCPYEFINKMIIESDGKQYYYIGDTDDDKRSGFGRTAMSNGRTAYEGGYKNDSRDGVGVYYYRTGKLCYAGSWKENKRSGLGVAFSSADGSAFIGKWENNESVGIGASFDKNGDLVYLGRTTEGKRDGVGITYSSEKETFFVGKYKNGEFSGEGTQFDMKGNMLYTGGYRGGVRIGTGVSYNTDGSVCYRGEWRNNLYNGEGILSLPDGTKINGEFKSGKASGQCTLTDKEGRVIYKGTYANDLYNGMGRLFSEDGGYAEGRFVDGEPTGIFNEYNADNELVYCGEWNDMRRSGKGIEYRSGEKVYEGEFRDSKYSGNGREFENGELIYEGEFVHGVRCGSGISYKNGDICYIGMWKDNTYNGCGILYSDGEPRYAGQFTDGVREGRINEISSGRVLRSCIYKNDELVYMNEYSNDGLLIYSGSMRNDTRSGMGCLMNESCEKEFEGIFKNGLPDKPMRVLVKELDEIGECSELESTDFELYRHSPEYALEIPYCGGVYSGQTKQGIPEGKGTILYEDHRYTGMFRDGKPFGDGIIYLTDGSIIKGDFVSSEVSGSDTIPFEGITYYRLNNDSEV